MLSQWSSRSLTEDHNAAANILDFEMQGDVDPSDETLGQLHRAGRMVPTAQPSTRGGRTSRGGRGGRGSRGGGFSGRGGRRKMSVISEEGGGFIVNPRSRLGFGDVRKTIPPNIAEPTTQTSVPVIARGGATASRVRGGRGRGARNLPLIPAQPPVVVPSITHAVSRTTKKTSNWRYRSSRGGPSLSVVSETSRTSRSTAIRPIVPLASSRDFMVTYSMASQTTSDSDASKKAPTLAQTGSEDIEKHLSKAGSIEESTNVEVKAMESPSRRSPVDKTQLQDTNITGLLDSSHAFTGYRERVITNASSPISSKGSPSKSSNSGSSFGDLRNAFKDIDDSDYKDSALPSRYSTNETLRLGSQPHQNISASARDQPSVTETQVTQQPVSNFSTSRQISASKREADHRSGLFSYYDVVDTTSNDVASDTSMTAKPTDLPQEAQHRSTIFSYRNKSISGDMQDKNENLEAAVNIQKSKTDDIPNIMDMEGAQMEQRDLDRISQATEADRQQQAASSGVQLGMLIDISDAELQPIQPWLVKSIEEFNAHHVDQIPRKYPIEKPDHLTSAVSSHPEAGQSISQSHSYHNPSLRMHTGNQQMTASSRISSGHTRPVSTTSSHSNKPTRTKLSAEDGVPAWLKAKLENIKKDSDKT
jgi:hypothetical protein